MSDYAEIHVTCGNQEEAAEIADALIARRLAACVHLTPVASVYRWDGSVEHDTEISLTAKTRSALFGEVASIIGELHSYDLPAVTTTPMAGTAAYLGWIDAETAPLSEPG
jgi:periplasmic divalent cation tolerance protein